MTQLYHKFDRPSGCGKGRMGRCNKTQSGLLTAIRVLATVWVKTRIVIPASTGHLALQPNSQLPNGIEGSP